MADFVIAQVSFTATLHSTGHVTIAQSYTYRENYLSKPVYSHDYSTLEGTCEPNDLPYALWAEMEAQV